MKIRFDKDWVNLAELPTLSANEAETFMLSKVISVVFTLLASMPSLASDGRAMMMPFGIETYTLVTKETFSIHSKQDCALVKPGALADLLEKSSAAESTFDEQRVRGVLEESDDSVFVNARGVFQYKEKTYLVTENNFRSVLKRHFFAMGV